MNDLAPSDGNRPSNGSPGYAPQVVIVIIRTGGIAGLHRQWQVEPPLDEAPHWVALIEQCPWDDPDHERSGADRYIWSIRAHTPADRRERDVPDQELAGPWRALVDAVRDAASAT